MQELLYDFGMQLDMQLFIYNSNYYIVILIKQNTEMLKLICNANHPTY